MATKMREALQRAVETIDSLFYQIEQLKEAGADGSGTLRVAVSEAREVKTRIQKILAQKPKAKPKRHL